MNDEPTIAASTTLRDPSDDATLGAFASSSALLVIDGELSGRIFALDRARVCIGRDEQADISLAYAGVSRQHSRIDCSSSGDTVHDCQSKNGTFINNRRLHEPVVLKKGDHLRIGPLTFQYLPRDDPERQIFERLERRTQLDGFTGCYNKSYFNERAELEVRCCLAQGDALSLIVFDLDHFKLLNDGYGHAAGDAVLKELAHLIQRTGVRQHDVFARFGGEEFVVLLPQTALDRATLIAERIRQRIAQHAFEFANLRLPVTVSVGVAACGSGIVSATALFRAADAALYQAKQAGRNRVQSYAG